MSVVEDLVRYLRDHAGEILLRLGVAIVIGLIAYVVGRLVARLAATLVSRRRSHRTKTLMPIVRSVVFAALFGAGLVMALDHVGIDVATLLAGAGIVGLAIGFGAQTLVKDCLSGFFLIFDDVIEQGDTVEIDGVTGTVERVGLRMTTIRQFNGELWYVPNGAITKVGNWNREWAHAVVDVGVWSSEDVARAIDAIRRVGEAWAKQNSSAVLAGPETQVLSFTGTGVNLELAIKLKNEGDAKWRAERELRLRIRKAFDEHGIRYGAPPLTPPKKPNSVPRLARHEKGLPAASRRRGQDQGVGP